MKRAVTSTRAAPDGTGHCAAVPMQARRSPLTTTTPFGTPGRPVPSMIVAPTSAVACAAAVLAVSNKAATIGERTGLPRPARLWESRRDLERVPKIDLLQHRVREPDAVQLPEGVIAAVVVEVLVARLEHAPVVRILRRLERILSEQQAVLVLDEEVVRPVRLAPAVV